MHRHIASQGWTEPQSGLNFPFMATFKEKTGAMNYTQKLYSGFYWQTTTESYFGLSKYRYGAFNGYAVFKIDMKTTVAWYK